MIKPIVIICCLFLGLTLMAQDTIQKPVDQRYREDQFYIGLTYNLITDVPGGVATRGLSGGLHFGFLRDMPVTERRNIAVAVGVGMSIDRFGQTLFIGEALNEETIFSVLDGDIDYNTNRFSVATIEAPIQFRWRSSTAASTRFWRVYAGFHMGYSYWYKATFKQSNNNVDQTKISEFDPVRMGASLSFGYNTFNFYAYYSINPFFTNAVTDKNQAVDFRTIKVGLMFYIL